MTQTPDVAEVSFADRMTSAAPDRLSLRDHIVEVEIGAFQQERGITQRIMFNLVADLAAPAVDGPQDDVDTILSYDVFLDAIDAELSGQRLNLLETLAEGIASRVLSAGGVAQILVRIEKLDRCDGALGVEIQRRPALSSESVGKAEDKPAAHIVLLPWDSLTDPALSAALKRISDRCAAVLCLQSPPNQVLQSNETQAQRRIDLLSLGQSAWALAGQHPECVVVESRTEMDWGLRHGQLSVWAPSKMVVDAREPDAPKSAKLTDLAVWLARSLDAKQVDVVGDVGLEDASDEVTLRRVTLADVAR